MRSHMLFKIGIILSMQVGTICYGAAAAADYYPEQWTVITSDGPLTINKDTMYLLRKFSSVITNLTDYSLRSRSNIINLPLISGRALATLIDIINLLQTQATQAGPLPALSAPIDGTIISAAQNLGMSGLLNQFENISTRTGQWTITASDGFLQVPPEQIVELARQSRVINQHLFSGNIDRATPEDIEQAGNNNSYHIDMSHLDSQTIRNLLDLIMQLRNQSSSNQRALLKQFVSSNVSVQTELMPIMPHLFKLLTLKQLIAIADFFDMPVLQQYSIELLAVLLLNPEILSRLPADPHLLTYLTSDLVPESVLPSLRATLSTFMSSAAILMTNSTSWLMHVLRGFSGFITSLGISPNSQFIAGSINDTVRLWNTQRGQTASILRGHSNDVTCVAFSPDSRMLASGSSDNTIRLWDLNTEQSITTLIGHVGRITSVQFSPNGQLLASASHDRSVRIWDVSTGQTLHILADHTAPVIAVRFSPNGRLLASAGQDDKVFLYNIADNQITRILLDYTRPITALEFSPDGQWLASASDDATIRVWQVSTGRTIYTFTNHTERVASIAFSPDSTKLASVSRDMTVKLWDLSTGQLVRNFSDHTNEITGVAFSPDGKWIVSVSFDQTIRLWNTVNEQQKKVFTLPEHFYTIKFAPHGQFFAAASLNSLSIWHGPQSMIEIIIPILSQLTLGQLLLFAAHAQGVTGFNVDQQQQIDFIVQMLSVLSRRQ